MALDQKDVELIERIIYKNADDIAVSIARSFERIEERIDAAESRIASRCADLEDKAEEGKDDVIEYIGVRVNPIATDVAEIADDLKSLRECMTD